MELGDPEFMEALYIELGNGWSPFMVEEVFADRCTLMEKIIVIGAFKKVATRNNLLKEGK